MSRLIAETDEYLELVEYIHHEPDEYSSWELDDKCEPRYADFVHEAEHYALYEIACTYRISKATGKVEYISWR